MSLDTNALLAGRDGRVWWNGRLLATLTKVEIKMSGDFEDIEVCGDPTKYSLYNGWNGSGTLTLLKVDSEIVDQMIEAYTSGEMPDIQIVTALQNAKTKQSARYQISAITITEILVAAFEAKKRVEEEIPFNFAAIKKLEGIAA